MKTNIVYVVVSSDSDIYLEQAWVSIYSLRHYNADAHICVVCDKQTEIRITRKANFTGLLNEVVAVEFDNSVPNKERSRWLKTNLRSIVDGDFLFVDTDTVITGNLSELDRFDMDLGMVYDWHCPLKNRPNQQNVRSHVRLLFNHELKPTTDYFNSGVIYAKDTEATRYFFRKWHENWLAAKDKPSGMEDQQSLTVTIDEIGGVVPISGIYNCQPIVSMEFIVTAKIMHFFNTRWSNHILSPFYDRRFYDEIKREGAISADKQTLIINCKSAFVSPSMAIMQEDIVIWKSSSFKFLRRMYNHHPWVYKQITRISYRILRLMPVKGES